MGRVSGEVKKLQMILNSDPDTRVSAKGAGSVGKETNYYGPATRAAVAKFQLKYGIVKSSKAVGYGNLGPKTQAMLKKLFGK